METFDWLDPHFTEIPLQINDRLHVSANEIAHRQNRADFSMTELRVCTFSKSPAVVFLHLMSPSRCHLMPKFYSQSSVSVFIHLFVHDMFKHLLLFVLLWLYCLLKAHIYLYLINTLGALQYLAKLIYNPPALWKWKNISVLQAWYYVSKHNVKRAVIHYSCSQYK